MVMVGGLMLCVKITVVVGGNDRGSSSDGGCGSCDRGDNVIMI